MVLEKILESPLDCKEIPPVHPKRNQSWIFIGRSDAEVEIPILWPPHVKNWLTGKDRDAGKDWGRRRGWQDEMVGWHHQLDGHESEQAPGVGDEQGSLVCCMQSMGSQSWIGLSDWTKLNYWINRTWRPVGGALMLCKKAEPKRRRNTPFLARTHPLEAMNIF